MTVSHGSTLVLPGIDADLAAGEVLTLVGENGAGKSTLLRCVTGLHGTTHGLGATQLDRADKST